MGIFSDIFGSGKDYKRQSSGHWNYPSTIEDIERLFSRGSGVQIIYKHSFTCGICTMAKIRFEKKVDEIANKARLNFIDVKANRPLSNHVAELTDIRHESPQLIILNEGEVFWHGSHGQINADIVLESLDELKG